jgi:hypothetical protein
MPPVRMTKRTPSAMMAVNAICRLTRKRFPGLIKFG